MITRNFPKPEGNAGLRETRWNREAETWVSLYDGEPAGMDTDGGRWQTVCERHGHLVSHPTLALARSMLTEVADWCEACQDRLLAVAVIEAEAAGIEGDTDGSRTEAIILAQSAVADRIDLPLDETEQGLTPLASARIDAFIVEAALDRVPARTLIERAEALDARADEEHDDEATYHCLRAEAARLRSAAEGES